MKKKAVLLLVVLALMYPFFAAKAIGPENKSASISPDGRWILFLHQESVGYSANLIDTTEKSEATHQIWMAPVSNDYASFVWSPDSKYVLLTDTSVEETEAYVYDVSTRKLVSQTIGYGLAFTADGGVFVSRSNADNTKREIFAVDFNGKESKQFEGDYLTFASNGDWFAYVTTDADHKLTVHDLRLNKDYDVATPFRMYNLQWSPVGDRIAFNASTDEGATWGVYEAGAGGDRAYLIFKGGEWLSFGWSPDGKSLAISNNGKIYFMSESGSEPKLLTDNGTNPQFYPDGSKILFETNREGFVNLYTMNPDGSDQKPLIHD